MSKMNIAVVQSAYKKSDVAYNVNKMKRQIEQCLANEKETELILFPELCTTGYFLDDELQTIASSCDGFHFQQLAEVAKQHSIVIAYGYVEKGADHTIYNSVQVINEEGQSIINYRKIHLTPDEQHFFSMGSDIIVKSIKKGTIGVMTCWDLAFPELARALANQGADLLLVPSAWEKPHDKPYEIFSQARAIDQTVFLATCNHVGASQELAFFGKAAIYGPDGQVIVKSSEEKEAILTAQLDFSERGTLKNTFFSMEADFREDLFKRW